MTIDKQDPSNATNTCSMLCWKCGCALQSTCLLLLLLLAAATGAATEAASADPGAATGAGAAGAATGAATLGLPLGLDCQRTPPFPDTPNMSDETACQSCVRCTMSAFHAFAC